MTERHYYPNNMGRILLLAMEEVLGRSGLNAVLRLAGLDHLIGDYPPNTFDRGFPFEHLGEIHDSLDRLYGAKSGRGLAWRAGRICFKYGMQEFAPNLADGNLAFRLLPLRMKVITGANALTDLFNRHSDQVVHVSEDADRVWWHVERCPVCWGRHTEAPCCHLAVGLIQESLYWVSGGRSFMVEEIHCCGRGDSSCSIQVTREPLD
ncbi:MAG: 4-vinyl reductase [Chloroflexota bacterium]